MSQSVALPGSGSVQKLHTSTHRCCGLTRRVALATPFATQPQRVRRRSCVVRAKEDAEDKGEKIGKRKIEEQTNKLVEGMKKGGIDQSTAQRILETWEQTGATTTDALRKMLLGRSLKTVGVVLFQLLLDAGAAYGSYNSARSGCCSC